MTEKKKERRSREASSKQRQRSITSGSSAQRQKSITSGLPNKKKQRQRSVAGISIPEGDRLKPPTTEDDMMRAFGFGQSHCDFCGAECGPLVLKCGCKEAYFCKPCLFTNEAVRKHKDKCASKKAAQQS